MISPRSGEIEESMQQEAMLWTYTFIFNHIIIVLFQTRALNKTKDYQLT